MTELQKACVKRDIKIDKIAANLINKGWSPWLAIGEAVRIFERNRKYEKTKRRTT